MIRRVDTLREWDNAALRGFPIDARYLVGVSGGRDSVTLLHWLQAQRYLRLIVCHFDHRLRARAGRADARFVERIAARAGLPFEGESEDIKARAAQSNCSIETAARAARYEFFAKVSRRRRCCTIFLGHHADDLVETFLFNLLRGSGSEGQRGMRAISVQKIDGAQLTVVRPLLAVWREQIDDYIQAHGLRFREDASNSSLQPMRNRVRHRIIPLIEKEFGRSIRKSLWRAAEIAAEEHAVLNDLMVAQLQQKKNLPVLTLKKLPVALQRRALRRWLREHAVADVSFELIESTRALLDSTRGPAKINLPGDRHARRKAGELFIE
ncbi:MAG: tRNA lysidine(34) synthetase TilS [Verrucomicrobiota bacterium]|nr:tRNA lysidine(34) synthetase TilS [Verrucomicrobiota bacterium]